MSDVFARLKARIASLPSNEEGIRQALAKADNARALSPSPSFAEEGQDMPGPMDAQAEAPSPPYGQQYQGEPGDQPAPISMRWILCPCTLVPVVLELDAGGVLTWQAGQFDDHVRALCEEQGEQVRAFLEDMPGHRWESWLENALDIADRWEASQGIQQRGQQHD